MNRTDSINFVKNHLGFLDDVLGLLQLIVLVELHLADQHSAEDEGFFVHLRLLLDLVNEGNGLHWVREPLHHSLGDLDQGQGVEYGLEINNKLLIHRDQLILEENIFVTLSLAYKSGNNILYLKTWFIDKFLKQSCKLVPQFLVVELRSGRELEPPCILELDNFCQDSRIDIMTSGCLPPD